MAELDRGGHNPLSEWSGSRDGGVYEAAAASDDLCAALVQGATALV
jgi:hypothetical protein